MGYRHFWGKGAVVVSESGHCGPLAARPEDKEVSGTGACVAVQGFRDRQDRK